MTVEEKDVSAPLDRALQAHLGRKLRRLFNETAAEPIPDRFADLLDRLDSGPSAPAQTGAGVVRPQEAF
jgi:hypothetical protein